MLKIDDVCVVVNDGSCTGRIVVVRWVCAGWPYVDVQFGVFAGCFIKRANLRKIGKL